eukprot:8363452-Pyramimonas_sp.AAC.1
MRLSTGLVEEVEARSGREHEGCGEVREVTRRGRRMYDKQRCYTIAEEPTRGTMRERAALPAALCRSFCTAAVRRVDQNVTFEAAPRAQLCSARR